MCRALVLPKFDKWPKIQFLGIIIATIYFFNKGYGIVPAIYGGMISLVNTFIISRHIKRQKTGISITAQASVVMMALSVMMRIATVAALVLIGLMVLNYDAEALIAGLVLGQIGFLLDKVKQI